LQSVRAGCRARVTHGGLAGAVGDSLQRLRIGARDAHAYRQLRHGEPVSSVASTVKLAAWPARCDALPLEVSTSESSGRRPTVPAPRASSTRPFTDIVLDASGESVVIV